MFSTIDWAGRERPSPGSTPSDRSPRGAAPDTSGSIGSRNPRVQAEGLRHPRELQLRLGVADIVLRLNRRQDDRIGRRIGGGVIAPTPLTTGGST